MKKARCRKLLAVMFSVLLMLSLSTAYAAPTQPGSEATMDIEATHSLLFYAAKASNGTGLVTYARVLSNVEEKYISISATLQQYNGTRWNDYTPYSGYVTNNNLCIVSEVSNPPKNYYYRVAFAYSSPTFNSGGILYSDSYLWQ